MNASEPAKSACKRGILLGVTALAVIVVCTAAYFKSLARFEASDWKNGSVATQGYSPDNPRARMLKDLLKNYLRLGMKRTEVLALLGKPDEEDERSLRYFLGGHSGGRLLPGYDYLTLLFDADGQLMEKQVQKSG